MFSTLIFCTPFWSKFLPKPATRPTLFVQSFLGAEIDFSQNSKSFGSMNTFYVLEIFVFLWNSNLVFWWDNFALSPSISGKCWFFHQNCRTKRPKLSFIKNQIFPIRRMYSLSRIFWNYEKSRSELGESPATKFWNIWLVYHWNPILALQVFEQFSVKLGYRAKFRFWSCSGS